MYSRTQHMETWRLDMQGFEPCASACFPLWIHASESACMNEVSASEQASKLELNILNQIAQTTASAAVPTICYFGRKATAAFFSFC